METGEFWEEPGYLTILFTIAAAALTGQSIPSPEAIWVMMSIFSSFTVFWKSLRHNLRTLVWDGHDQAVWLPGRNGCYKVWQFQHAVVWVDVLWGTHMIALQRRWQRWQVAQLLVQALSYCAYWFGRWWRFGLLLGVFSAGSKFLNNQNSCCRINASCLSSLRVGFGYPCSWKVEET